MMKLENVFLAFLLTMLAGLSTGIGSVIALFSKKYSPIFLSGSLGFSAGVMIYISFVEIFQKANILFVKTVGEKTGYFLTILSFFIGIFIIALIDKLVPSFENPHEVKILKEDHTKLYRMGLFSALAISIHNFPEGFATFISTLENSKIGIGVALATAIHNIPEGIAVSVPVYYATKNKNKAFWLSFLSGLSEPLGAIIFFMVLRNLLNGIISGVVYGIVAGIMVYISIDELLPGAEEYGKHHIAIGGLIGGMILIAFSLFLFK